MANISPFATIAGSLPPLIPKPKEQQAPQTMVFAPIHAPQLHALPSSMTDIAPAFAPPNAHTVNSPASLPGIEARTQDQLMADYTKDLHPWGSPGSTHPGVFGKILHGLNVATGGDVRRRGGEQLLENRIAGLESDQAKLAQESAQAEEEQAQAHNLENPASQPLSTDEGYIAFNPRTLATTPIHGANGEPLNVASTSKTPFKEYTSPDNQSRQWFAVGQQPEGWNAYEKPVAGGNSAFAQWSKDPNKYQDFVKTMDEIKAQVAAEHPQQAKNASFMNIYAAQRFLQMAYNDNPSLLPVASQMIGKLLKLTPEQTAEMGSVPEDQPLSPTTSHPIGLHMPGAPTGSTKTAAQNANKFITEYPRIRAEVNTDASNLGPVKGREVMGFLLGTVGSTGNPEADRRLSKLRTDLAFVGSNAAKFHINSVEQAKMFDELAAAGKSTAPAIQGFLDSVNQWAKTSANQIRGFGETGEHSSAAPKRYEMNGKEIVPREGKWVYKDTGKTVE